VCHIITVCFIAEIEQIMNFLHITPLKEQFRKRGIIDYKHIVRVLQMDLLLSAEPEMRFDRLSIEYIQVHSPGGIKFKTPRPEKANGRSPLEKIKRLLNWTLSYRVPFDDMFKDYPDVSSTIASFFQDALYEPLTYLGTLLNDRRISVVNKRDDLDGKSTGSS
jgi:hypothetical protein